MNHVPAPPKPVVSVSDAAMDRARLALSKVAYSPAKTQQIIAAAQMLPDVAVMAGAKHLPGLTVTMPKLTTSA